MSEIHIKIPKCPSCGFYIKYVRIKESPVRYSRTALWYLVDPEVKVIEELDELEPPFQEDYSTDYYCPMCDKELPEKIVEEWLAIALVEEMRETETLFRLIPRERE